MHNISMLKRQADTGMNKKAFFTKLALVLSVLGAFTVWIAPNTAHAQKIKDLFDKDMPTFNVLPQKEFEEQTFMRKDIPFGDKSLAYEIRLPKGWVQPEEGTLSNMSLSSKLFGEVALFYSPPKINALRSKFQIFALKLDYDTTAEQWLMQHVLSNGYNLEGIKYYNEDKVEALHVFLNEGQTYVVKSISQINGKRMILTQFIIPAESWAQESGLVSQCLESFKLLSPEPNVAIENWAKHLFLDIAEISYPESWVLSHRPVRTVDRMDIALNNIRKNETKVLDGQIEAAVISAFTIKDIEEEIQNVKLIYRKKGLLVNDLLESTEDYKFSKKAEFGFLDIYDANDPNNTNFNYEVWIAVMAIDKYYFFISMLTPSRDYDYLTWSRNTNAFRTVVSTSKMQDRAL